MVRENELKPYRFSNGREVMIRSVSPFTLLEARKAIPEPQAPIQDVILPDGRKVQEANYAHPEFQAAQRAYTTKMQDLSQKIVVKRGVAHTFTDDQKQEVADFRAWWQDEFGTSLGITDLEIYVLHICVSGRKDIERLVDAVTGMGQPTAEEVAAARQMFPGAVPGA